DARLLRLVQLGLGLWLVVSFVTHRGLWGSDLAALWFAGQFWAEGLPDLVYAAPPYFFGDTPPEWQSLFAAEGSYPGREAFPYLYPPLWAALMAPVTEAMPIARFFDLALALSLAMLAGSVLLAERIARPKGMARWVFLGWGLVVLATSTCARASIELLQPSIATAFLTLLSFALLRRYPLAAGAALALAAALKLTPAAFVLLFLIRGQFRAAAGFAVAGGALALASLSLGWPIHAAFLAQLDHAGGHSIWMMMNPSARVLALYLVDAAGLAHLFEPLRLIARPEGHFALIFMPDWIGRAAALAALAVGLAGGALLARRPGRRADAIGLLALSVT
ncbi:MAG: DUF2029 domain-containing protein, partial [Sphingomonadales bacterium]|nr:DUF2029 domain-containing protein [Sphingomonadales bacterium]